MKKYNSRNKIASCVLYLAGSVTAQSVLAGGLVEELIDKTTFFGQVRLDAAYNTSGSENPYNQSNVPFQDVEVSRQAYIPPDLGGGRWGDIPIPALPFVLDTKDTVRRSDRIPEDNYDFTQAIMRFNGEMNTKFTRNLSLNIKVRALFDPEVNAGFDAMEVQNDQGGIAGGGGDRYADTGGVDFYQAKGRNGKNINPFEIAGRDYMLDFPTFILNYKTGKYDFRFGNQQIAWGQAVFFRTLDVANGLDLRRHLILDRAIEEYEDERTPKLAFRATMQATSNITADAFVGKFQPDVLPNPNSQFNVIPSQFYRPLDNYYSGDYDSKLDFGIRFKADYGNFGWQAMAVSRYNSLGVFKWAESGINKGLTPFGGTVGAIVETAYSAKPKCSGAQNPYDNFCRRYDSVGEALSHSPFTVGPGGVYSDKEWFSTASGVRLDGLEALNTAIAEFEGLRDVFASPAANATEAAALLNTFFIGAGGSIRGNVQRDYYREQVFGLGGSYVNETEDIDSFWNQVIVNVEVQYTPERVYTSPGLARDGITSDEYIFTAVAEKWHRWSETFPSAYLVAQYMHRSESDLVGLHLSGYGGNVGNTDYKRSDGISGADYLVFAGFQPWPNKKFVAEWAFLYDIRGGILAQPLIKWNPGSGLSVDLFYNYLKSNIRGDSADTLTRSLDHIQEVGIRIGYQL